METSQRTICDPIHNHMTIHPLCNKIIDTPQFQRLRYILQLGFCDYVFPGATHTRFSHSLGVSYIAGVFTKHLRSSQPELNITSEEILCLEIAGLCHDLGHAPFSHSWELFMKLEGARRGNGTVWKHEDVSLTMFEYLIKVNELEDEFAKYNLTREHIEMIKNMICGNMTGNEDRAFLFQIINNDGSGLDVDKWDYFLRDAYFCGINQITFAYERLICCARVIRVDGSLQICFREKEDSSILNMFRTRNRLYETVYAHRVAKLIESIFCESLALSCRNLKICPELEAGDLWQWCMDVATTNKSDPEFLEKMEKYCYLTESSVLAAILNLNGLTSEEREAKRLLKSFKCGRTFTDEFQWIGKVVVKKLYTEEESKDSILKHFPQSAVDNISSEVLRERIFVQVTKYHYGKCEKNPLNFVYFYSKNNINEGKKYNPEEMSLDLPISFQKIEIRVFGRNCDEKMKCLLRHCFEEFKKELRSET